MEMKADKKTTLQWNDGGKGRKGRQEHHHTPVASGVQLSSGLSFQLSLHSRVVFFHAFTLALFLHWPIPTWNEVLKKMFPLVHVLEVKWWFMLAMANTLNEYHQNLRVPSQSQEAPEYKRVPVFSPILAYLRFTEYVSPSVFFKIFGCGLSSPHAHINLK